MLEAPKPHNPDDVWDSPSHCCTPVVKAAALQQTLFAPQTTLFAFFPRVTGFAQHPEDQILSIVRERGSVLRGELPKHLRRTSRWTHNLEKQGAIRRVKQRGPDKINRLQLVLCQPPHQATRNLFFEKEETLPWLKTR